jgi:hypothetical protein
MKKRELTREEFGRLKQHLYQALHGLELSLQSCPELQNVYMELPDKHKLFPGEAVSLLQGLRSECWKYGPADVQDRHIREIVSAQPWGGQDRSTAGGKAT